MRCLIITGKEEKEFMNKVAVLDCTLRDGGYVNDFDFSKNTIKTIINKLGKAHMDIIECGFLKNIEYDENKSLYSDVDQITPLITPKKKHTMYVAMIVTGTIQASKIRSMEFVSHFIKKKWMKHLNLGMH